MIEFDILKKQLETPLEKLDFVAFDFETTGLHADTDRIIEIGALKFRLANDGPRFSTLINPEIPIPRDSTRINGITDAAVKGKPLILDVLPHFMNFIGDAVLVAHNAQFDTGFFLSSLRACSLEPLNNHIIDTMELAKQVIKKARKYSLAYLCEFLALPLESHHRADSDALACLELFRYCVNLVPGRGGTLLKGLYN